MWRWTLWLVLLCVGAGCSFNSDWKRMASHPVRTNDISGRWIGHWRSDRNDHNGQLRCILTPNSTNAHMARFRAQFWKVFATSYAVPLTLTQTNGGYTFQGQADLGKLGGGVYTYDGTITPFGMESIYNSKHDYGTFVLRRPRRGE
jgi:hypothetical protein